MAERLEEGPWGWVLAQLDVGVAVFFVLSGFLLYRPFAAAHLEGRPRPSLGGYARNRFLRIYPAWWAALAILVLLDRVTIPNAGAALMWITLLVGFEPLHFLFNGLFQAWTLTIEVCFYVLVPIVGWAASRVEGSADRRRRAQVVAVALLFGTGLTYRAGVATWFPGHPSLVWLPANLALFAIGMGAAVASVLLDRPPDTDGAAAPGRLARGARTAAAHPAVCWAGAAAAFAALCTMLDLPRTVDLFEPMSAAQDLGRHVLFGLVAGLLLLPGFLGTGGRIRGLLASRPFVLLGLVSYGIYLWHVDLLRVLVAPDGVARSMPLALLVVVVAAGSAAAGALSYVLIERPALRLRRRERSAAAARP